MAAAKNGRMEVVNKLLDQKVNVDAQSKHGVTALMLAAENNQGEIVDLLLKKNADPNLQDQTRVVSFDEGCLSRKRKVC